MNIAITEKEVSEAIQAAKEIVKQCKEAKVMSLQGPKEVMDLAKMHMAKAAMLILIAKMEGRNGGLEAVKWMSCVIAALCGQIEALVQQSPAVEPIILNQNTRGN